VSRFQRGRASRILRLEKSVQIARPPQEVFDVWSDFEELAKYTETLESVRSSGRRSHWVSNVAGVPVEWNAEITQIIPNQSIGWKSLRGPKHSGRITFSPIGNDTLVHVQMNYAPPARFLRRALSPFVGDVEGYIERALRDVKAGLERSGRTSARKPATPDLERERQAALGRATGTYGPEVVAENQNPKFSAPSTAVEYTAPPEAKR